MKLFQYWNTPTPPDEVAAWIDGFRTRNREFEHTLFNEDSAAAFIRERFGQRHHDAFRLCAIPAMQADFIRLCAILTYGGVYVDADNQSIRPLSELIARAPRSMLFTYAGQLNNAFMMFREPRDPFLEACLAFTLSNIEHRRFKAEFTATGPAIWSAIQMRLDPTCRERIMPTFDNIFAAAWGVDELFALAETEFTPTEPVREAYFAITQVESKDAVPWIGADLPAYKSTGVHWLNWKGKIYRTPEEVIAITG